MKRSISQQVRSPRRVETWTYLRYSSSKQNDLSVEQQLTAVGELCTREGFPEPLEGRRYADRAKSAKSLKGREALARLIRDAETAAVSDPGVQRILLLWNIDRLGRNLFDAIGVAGRLSRDLGFRIATISDELDSDSDDFRSALARSAEHADTFLVRLGKNTKRGLADARRKGHDLGKCPIGFKREASTKTFVPDHAALKWVAYAFSQAHALRGHVSEVIRRLRQQPTGHAWSHKRTLTRMLRNRRYIDTGAVSQVVFDAVQKFIDNRGSRFNRDPKGRLRGGAGTGHSALIGLFRCTCGAPVVTTKRDLLDRRLGCRRHGSENDCANSVTVRESVLLKALLDEVRERVLDPAAIDMLTQAVTAKVEAAAASAGAEAWLIDDLLADRTQRIRNLVSKAEATEVPMPELQARLQELRAELAELQASRAAVVEPATVTVLRTAVTAYLPRLAGLLAGRGPETAAVLRELISGGLMTSEGRGKARFDFTLAPLGGLVSVSPSGLSRTSWRRPWRRRAATRA
jgi:DNA invertase Pin-like site-specific DNA recombinase